MGDIADASELYNVWLDRTPPAVTAAVDESLSYTLNLSATDELSGVDAVSVDGGAVWLTPQADGAFVYTAPGETTLEPGMVQVRDKAGNVWLSAESYSLTAVSGGTGFGAQLMQAAVAAVAAAETARPRSSTPAATARRRPITARCRSSCPTGR